MKNSKKLLASICSILTLTCGVAGIAACQKNQGELNPAPKEDEYEYNYTTNYEGENDPGINIDGKLDEDVWQDKNWFTNHFYADVNDTMPSINVTAFTTEYGVYMGVKVRDDNVVYIGSMDQSKNTTFEFYYYADKSDTVLADRDYSSRHAFMLDCGGELYSTCERMKRAVIVDGEVNSGATTGATAEIFVPWSELRIDVSDGVYPQNLFMLPKYRPILKGSTASTLMHPMPFNPMHHMMNYYVFDANGYTDVDQDGAEVGDSFNGLAKTGNWDLENLDEGKLSVTSGVEFNSIYFKDVFAESFVAETMIYPLEGHTGYDGRYAGFWLLSTNGNYYTMMVDMRTSRYVKAQDGRYTLNEFGLVTLTEAHRYWEQVTKLTKDNPSVDVDVAPATSGVRFKIIKDADTIHYFINDEYFYSETLDFVQGKVYIGLFNMNVYAEYEEFWCMPLEGEDLEVELNNCDIYKVNAQVTTAGGYVALDKEYAVAGEDIDLKIVTDSGYKVSSVTCNGEDITESVSVNASKGVYRIENVNENTKFEVTFEKIETPVTYKGKLFIEGMGGRKEYVSSSVILVNKAANEQRYEIVSTANRGFELKTEAGEYELYVDGYFGNVPLTLSESVVDVQEINIGLLAAVGTTNTHYMNLDFVAGSANTVQGRQGQWFVFDNASEKVYASAKIYNYDLDGFTIETEDGANVQFYFGYQGFFMLKNHDWVFVDGMKSWDQYGYYNSENKMKILNPTNVESLDGSLVEIAIVDGYLYVAINGIGKAQFELSEFSPSFTADAKYFVGFCTYNGTNAKYPNGGARWEDISAKFGSDAADSVEAIQSLCAVEEYSLGTELYGGTAMTKLDTTITYTAEAVGAQVFDGVEFERNTDFVVYATIASGMTAENVGFVVGTLGADNSKHLLFQWRRNQKDLYVWRESKKDVWGWSGTADNVINSDVGTQGAEIALVYKNGKYYAFLNGAQVCAIGIAIDDGWGGSLNVSNIIGTEGALKVGLSVAYGMVQFTNVGYSTDKTEINKYQIDDMPAIGANVYSGGAYSEGLRADGSYRLDTKQGAGAAFFKDVEIEQGQDYVVYTTISAPSANLNMIGFAVGTLASPSSFAMISWRKNPDIYVVRLADKGGAWGWAGESIATVSVAPKASEIALVYKGGEYYFFVNGQQIAYLDKDAINSLAGIGATADTVKIGFSVNWTGDTVFSNWGYSTDADVIGGYATEIPEAPVDPNPEEPEPDEPPVVEDGTVEKPGVGNNIYAANNREIGIDEEGNFLFNTEKGAVFFNGSSVEQGQAYVVYATMSYIGGTPDGIGFAVGTLANNDAQHAMFLWREKDIYVVRMENGDAWGWSGETLVPCSKTHAAATLALVYKDGTYYMFIDGEQVFEWSETAVYDGWGQKIQNMVGTEGTLKLGLANLSSDATFTDWGYSTDEEVIGKYFETEEPPVEEDETFAIGTEIYAGSMTKKGDVVTYTSEKLGAQTFDGVEFAQGTNYVVYATIDAGMTAENVGFVVGTLGADNSKHLMFQWRKNQGDLYVWKDLGGWVGHEDKIFKSSIGTNGARIALVYKNGTYYVFLNGSQVCSFGDTFDNGWGGTVNVANTIGKDGTIKVGLSIAYGMAQFSEYGYSTDASVINGYVPDPEEPPVEEDETFAIGTEIYAGSMTKKGDVVTYTSEKLGAQTFDGVEFAQDTNYVVYATIDAGMTAENVGFIVGTLGADNSKHLLFQWRRNQGDLYIWKDKGGWVGHADGVFKSSIGTNGAEIALVYKNGTYYAFLNGTLVCQFGATFDNGWGGNVKVAETIGTEGTLKVGLSIAFGTAQFSEYGYSTDASVIGGYIPDEKPSDKTVKNPALVDKANTFGAIVGDNYGNWSLNVTETEAKVHGGYVFEGDGVKNGEAYMVQATVNKNSIASEIGFVVSSKYADNENGTSSKYMLIVYRKNNASKPLYFWSSNLWGDMSVNSGVTAFANGDEMTITLIYANNTYYVFFDDALACSVQEDTKIDGWNPTLKSAVGDGEYVRLGLVATNKETTFTNWSYSTDEATIAEWLK